MDILFQDDPGIRINKTLIELSGGIKEAIVMSKLLSLFASNGFCPFNMTVGDIGIKGAICEECCLTKYEFINAFKRIGLKPVTGAEFHNYKHCGALDETMFWAYTNRLTGVTTWHINQGVVLNKIYNYKKVSI